METMRLIDWCRDESKHPSKEMFAHGAYWHQILFVRDRLASMLAGKYIGESDDVAVVNTHRSKSVECPVYKIETTWAAVVLRYNFHDWNVTVVSKVGDLDTRLDDLLHGGHAGYLFFQGMDGGWMRPAWPERKDEFSFSVGGDYDLYTILFLLKRAAVASEPSPG